MAQIVPTSANEFIEYQLLRRLSAIESNFDSDALCLVAPLLAGVDDLIRNVVEELRRRQNNRRRLVVLLTTDGGIIETVQRIVETLRHHYDHVVFVIPNYAFSAGTVLAMSGDEIYMDYYSRLGPIDPQVQNSRGRFVPALGYLRKWDQLLEKATQGDLTLAELNLMVDGFDQAELYQYEQSRELSVTLLVKWLVAYKFKNWTVTKSSQKLVTPEMRENRAEAIARDFCDTDRWHSHGHGISMEVLQTEINLRIDDLADNPKRHDLIKQHDALLSDYMSKMRQRGVVHTVRRYIPFLVEG